MEKVSKVWKCGGIIGTLNYLFAIRTIQIVWTIQYSYSVHYQNQRDYTRESGS